MIRKAFIFLMGLMLLAASLQAAEPADPSVDKAEPPPGPISVSGDVSDVMAAQAALVKDQIEQQARSLFEHSPLGWDWRTIEFLYKWALSLPLKLPALMQGIVTQGRLLGVVGSLIMLTFLVALFYSLMGQRRVVAKVEQRVQPLRKRLPETVYPYFLAVVKIVVAALIPLLLLGALTVINAFIEYRATWFVLLRQLLVLWTQGVLALGLLRESLKGGLFPSTARFGASIYKVARLLVWYVVAGLALLSAAEAFELPPDVLAFIRFVISLSIVLVVFVPLIRKKQALLSIVPELPYATYQTFLRLLERYYTPLILFTFVTAILWCLGYKQFGRILLARSWLLVGSFVGLMIVYHLVRGQLIKWAQAKSADSTEAQYFFRSVQNIWTYATVTTMVLVALQVLGLLEPLARFMSFPVMRIGTTPLSLWTLLKAGLILLAFFYVARLLQSYLDYKVYPTIGIDEGLGYAINTFLRYLILVVGALISLRIVGIDLKVLMVFAGAVGIGVGLGLQNIAANVIAGFAIIFGGKIRKGDWVQVSDTMGVVTDIYLRATKIRTRDNVEYIVPNADFLSNIIVNYTLSSPTIRIAIPVGVSYDANPEVVEKILLEAARQHSPVMQHHRPAVRFVEYGDNSINFQLLIWFDIRKHARRKIVSMLYFTIFRMLKEAGIEIPFPQRDLHIRSGLPEAMLGTDRPAELNLHTPPKTSTG